VLAPIRDERLTRERRRRGSASAGSGPLQKDAAVSINAGLWGVTAGGRETHDSWLAPTEASFPTTTAPSDAPGAGTDLVLAFEDGLPVGVDGEPVAGWHAVARIAEIASGHAIGRGRASRRHRSSASRVASPSRRRPRA
jgi:argininosuccinate synthase